MASPDSTRDHRWLAALLLLVALFCAPMLVHPGGFLSGDTYRDNDWLTDRFFDLAAHQAIREHGVLPLRSHLVGGGFPTAGHPFDGSWAPTLPAILAFGPVLGVKVNLLILLALGTLGVFALARRWMGLPPPAAGFAAGAFAVSGWLPSMMLVGFWPQALYMVTPALLALLQARAPSARIAAGALLFVLLQQGGNGLVAVCAFLAAVAWVQATVTSGSRQPLGWLLVATGSLAIGRRYGVPAIPVGALAISAAWALRSQGMAAFGAAILRPGARILAALLVMATLGVGKIVAMAPVVAAAEYAHAGNLAPSLWPAPGPNGGIGRVLAPGEPDEHFFDGPSALVRGLLQRAPKVGDYAVAPPPRIGSVPLEPSDVSHARAEYIYVGLTAPILLLALLGAGAALRERRPALPLLFAGAVAVCMGPHLLPDLHFLLAGGLPGVSGLSQPIKYYSFFVLLPAALLAGRGALVILARTPRIGAALLVLSLGGAALQNAPAWADRFAEPLPAWECPDCRQIKQIGHPDWVGWPGERIDRLSDALYLRERRRPPAAREYDNAVRGVGTVDWYGTLRLPEPVVPSHFVTPSGRVLANPAWSGEAWTGRGATVPDVIIGPHRIEARLRLASSDRLVINQAYLPGFDSTHGAVIPQNGLLALDLPAGDHTVVFTYRPGATIAGLATSAAFALFWGATFVVLRRRQA